MVFVLDQAGNPLMPTKRHGKVRRMLRDKKAKVVRSQPFTIQLLYESEHYTQPVTLGVDAGSKHIGLSASSEKEEYLAMDVELRTDLVQKLSDRRELRNSRRNRKTRYRKARFNNRKKEKGWLAPSVEHKIDCHLTQIELVTKLLPVTEIIMETASFDTQKLKNPDIEGEQYQNGEQKDFWNVREYVLFRDNHECQHCHGKSKDPILNVHHLESRKTGGNAPGNLITLCETCHREYHSLSPEKQKKWNLPKRANSYRDSAFMGIMRWTLLARLKESYPNIPVRNTYGYLTKNKRIQLGLAKEHYNDAYCIAGHLNAHPVDTILYRKKVRRHNRQIHKVKICKGGKRKLNQAPYIVCGFRLFDKVKWRGIVCFITGRRKSGYFVLKTIDGKKVSDTAKAKELKLLEERKGYISQRRERQFLPALA